jgi:hypothetical protein
VVAEAVYLGCLAAPPTCAITRGLQFR